MSSIAKLQQRVLMFAYNDYNAKYVDILRQAHIHSVSTAWQPSAVIEVYKPLNSLSPKYIQCMFTLNKNNHNLHSYNVFALNHFSTRQNIYTITCQMELDKDFHLTCYIHFYLAFSMLI